MHSRVCNLPPFSYFLSIHQVGLKWEILRGKNEENKYAPFYKKFGDGTEKGVYDICPIGRGWGHVLGSIELNLGASCHRTGCNLLIRSHDKLTNQDI